MVQASQRNVITTVVIATFIMLVIGLWGLSSIPTNSEIQSSIDDGIATIEIPEAPVVPTAEEIAELIVIPETAATDNSLFKDIIEGIYRDEVSDLEEDCQEALWEEYEDDILDDIEDLIEDDINDEIEDLEVTNWDYRDNYDFEVLNLGLDEEEDREGEITTVLRVRYHEVFGDDDYHSEKVYVSAVCSDWDKDDNEFDDLEVEYLL